MESFVVISAAKELFVITVILCIWVDAVRAEDADEFLKLPLAKSAPAELRPLLERGRVVMKFVPADELRADEWGRCDFHLTFERKFTFDTKSLMKGSKRFGRVKVTSIDCDIKVTHLIRLRNRFAPPRTWEAPVTWHEFDHVTISTDPRPVLLLQYLAEHLPPIERPITRPDAERLPKLAEQWINEELQRRLDAVTELIRQNNRQLDTLSSHGTETLTDRKAFFANLYTKSHLAEEKFPFLNEALPVFEQDDYKPIER
jgi:hypothetical protein